MCALPTFYIGPVCHFECRVGFLLALSCSICSGFCKFCVLRKRCQSLEALACSSRAMPRNFVPSELPLALCCLVRPFFLCLSAWLFSARSERAWHDIVYRKCVSVPKARNVCSADVTGFPRTFYPHPARCTYQIKKKACSKKLA